MVGNPFKVTGCILLELERNVKHRRARIPYCCTNGRERHFLFVIIGSGDDGPSKSIIASFHWQDGDGNQVFMKLVAN